MIDTTTVNFAINKLSQAWQTAAPQIKNISEEFIKFTVIKAISSFVFIFLGLIFVLICFIPVLKYGYGKDKDWYNVDEPGFMIPLILLCAAGIILIIGTFCSGCDAVLALYCPEMFTIDQIISAAKK
jgi:O-antigen/teichoic acid export membrane protein